MPAKAAIYIQKNKINLFDVFDDVKTGTCPVEKTSCYEVTLGEDVVRFNIMPPSKVPKHIQGFQIYIKSLDQDQKRKDNTSSVISFTQIVLGLSTEREFEENHAIWQSLFKIADKYAGVVFVNGSVVLSNGAVLLGPPSSTNT